MSSKTTPFLLKQLATIAAFALLIAASTAIAQVGLDKVRVGKDLRETLADATGSMLTVQSFDIIDTTQLAEGRFQVDVSMKVKADEQVMANAVARAKANRLAANWREEAARVEQMAQTALQKDGKSESIKAIYEINNRGSWQLVEISDNTSDYTRLRNEAGPNSAPEETQVKEDFNQLIKVLSNGSATIEKFTINGADKLSGNSVRLKIEMTMQGNNSNADNIEFARGVNGVTNLTEAVYHRDPRGNWRRVNVD